MKIGIWYIYYDNPNPNWETQVSRAFDIALPRLRNYFGTHWDYQFMREFHTSVRYDKAIMPNKCIQAITELANTDPDFKADYNRCELPFFVFANSTDAFIFDHKSPVWSSDDAFVREQEGLVLIEHEIGHTFGLPDHVKPWAKPYYENCMMGNPYVGGIKLCPECEPKFVLSNYKKHAYSSVVNATSDEIPIIPQEPPEEPVLPEPSAPYPSAPAYIGIGGLTYAYWAGGIPQQVTSYNTWPSDREITCSFQVKNHELSSRDAIIVIEFAGQRSSTLRIAPGQTGEVVFVLQPFATGQYTLSMRLIESGAQFGYETMQVNVVPSEPPIIPVYHVTGVGLPSTKVIIGAGALIVVGLGLLIMAKR